MTNNFKIGDKLLLPVEITYPANVYRHAYAKVTSGSEVPIYPADIPSLIPASTLTDLQAENDRLKTAFKIIVDMLEQANHRDVLPEMIYQTAVKALGGE